MSRRSPARPQSTAPSSTGTATCSPRSTPSQAAPPADGQHRRPGRHLRFAASRPARRPRARARLDARIRQLENRLSEALGEQAWHESGLGTPADIDALTQKISHLQQQVIDLRLQLEERDQDLTAARSANRELMAQLNPRTPSDDTPHTVLAPHLPRTLTSSCQPLSCANTEISLRRSR